MTDHDPTDDRRTEPLTLEDHGGHFYGSGPHYRDLNGYTLEDGTPISIDHLVSNSGGVLVRINGTPLSDLGREPYDHHLHDETCGVTL